MHQTESVCALCSALAHSEEEGKCLLCHFNFQVQTLLIGTAKCEVNSCRWKLSYVLTDSSATFLK